MPTLTTYHWSSVLDCVMHEANALGEAEVVYTHESAKFGPLLSEHRGGTETYHHYDALGSTTILTNDVGTMTDTFAYDAWGSLISHTGTSATPYHWLGRWGYHFDLPTNGYYVRSRSYQPTIAQWTSVDPLPPGFADIGYIYCHLSPTRRTDPSGLKCTVCNVLTHFTDPYTVMDERSTNPFITPHRDLGFELLGSFNIRYSQQPPTFLAPPLTFPVFGAPPGAGSRTFLDRETKLSYGNVVALFFFDFDVCKPDECQISVDEATTVYESTWQDNAWVTTTTSLGSSPDDPRCGFFDAHAIGYMPLLRSTKCRQAIIVGDDPNEISDFVNDVYRESRTNQLVSIRDGLTGEVQAQITTVFGMGFAKPANRLFPNRNGYFKVISSTVEINSSGQCCNR